MHLAYTAGWACAARSHSSPGELPGLPDVRSGMPRINNKQPYFHRYLQNSV